MPAAGKTHSQCTKDELLRYLQEYFATIDIVTDALSKYETLAQDAVTAMRRSDFRALALGARRDLELLINQRRAFLRDEASINPPTEAAVREMELRAAHIAKIAATEARASAIVEIATQGLEAFNALNA
jgi:hypothetical protein